MTEAAFPGLSSPAPTDWQMALQPMLHDSVHFMALLDGVGRVLAVNPVALQAACLLEHEVIGEECHRTLFWLHDADQRDVLRQAIACALRGTFSHFDVTVSNGQGELTWFDLSLHPVRTAQGIEGVCLLGVDITPQHRAEEALRESRRLLAHQAQHDVLTGLGNRSLLCEVIRQTVARCCRTEMGVAVCMLDLDGFKLVNELRGHKVGDDVLVELAARLQMNIRAGDSVARLGGDEFAVVLNDINQVHEIQPLLQRLLVTLSSTYAACGQDFPLTVSIGVALFPQDGQDPDTLLRHADQAMYLAKQAGRNRYQFYDAEQDRQVRQHQTMIGDIHRAIQHNEFVLYYQPKVDMRRGEVVGLEALIRWQHPVRGFLQPGQFLPAIEQTDLIIDVGNWVLEQALQQLWSWQQAGLVTTVSVNVAARQLQRDDFIPLLEQLLQRYPDVPPERLELEILETDAVEDLTRTGQRLNAARRLGVSFALDDFGTGYSSLSYFRRLPAQILKIDQSFVRNMLEDPDDLAIVEGVIGLTSAFQRSAIAEGVETPEHGVMLLQLGCDLAQGYGIARPMPAQQVLHWVEHYRPDPLWQLCANRYWSRADFPLLAAEAELRRWVLDTVSVLEHPVHELPAETSFNHRQTRFGRWYTGHGGRQYRDLPEFKAIEPTHASVYAMGAQMVALCRAGNLDEALGLIPEIIDGRDVMLEQLRALELQVALNGTPE